LTHIKRHGWLLSLFYGKFTCTVYRGFERFWHTAETRGDFDGLHLTK